MLKNLNRYYNTDCQEALTETHITEFLKVCLRLSYIENNFWWKNERIRRF